MAARKPVLDVKHPAPFSKAVLERAAVMLAGVSLTPGASVLDPFAGVGNIHKLAGGLYDTIAIEIEPEWARQSATLGTTIQGDFFQVSARWRERFDAWFTSPVYPNRMTDHHDNRDTHKACGGEGCTKCGGTGIAPRRSYRHDLGRMPSPDSSATLAWGPEHRAFHRRAYSRLFRVTRRGGFGLLNISDHVKGFDMQPVVIWHTYALTRAGFEYVDAKPAQTQRMRNGENRDLRATEEWLVLVQRPKS